LTGKNRRVLGKPSISDLREKEISLKINDEEEGSSSHKNKNVSSKSIIIGT
jgi:hypothetical protein